MTLSKKRKYPIGAEFSPEGTSFRVFASNCQKVEVVDESDSQNKKFYALEDEGNGYFSGTFRDFPAGSLYRFRLDESNEFYPDPASRFQPEGPFGPSQIIDCTSFPWSDQNWKGVKIEDQIFYELHVGTFTKQGTYAAAQEEMQELAQLGITTIELMPLNDFPGNFGWGYDGVNLFAPTRLYGTADELKHFINTAHQFKLGVILDVVYNHFGPSGNFLTKFSNAFFQEKNTEWGSAINFDHPIVRQFFLTNVQYWIEEFHFDGLRLDATHAIFCDTASNILVEIVTHAHAVSKEREIIIVAENESQDSTLIRSTEKGGYGLHAVWNDDFHHVVQSPPDR